MNSPDTTRRRMAFTAVGLAAVAGGIYVGRRWLASPDTPPPASARATATLFAATLPDTRGVATPLARWQGQPLVLNFWATWCAPCVAEMPDLQKLFEAYQARGVGFVGIGIDKAEAIAEFATRVGVTYPLLVGGYSGTDLARDFGNANGSLPFTVVLNRNGGVAATRLGRIRAENLRSIIDSVLA